MRLPRLGFSVPLCIFDDDMPAKRRCLLVFLFRVSRHGGECRPGYAAMRRAMRDADGERGCNATVRRHLAALEADGWIHHMRRTQSAMLIYLQIPFRFRVKKCVEKALRVVSP